MNQPRKRGHASGTTRADIERAIAFTKSNHSAARYLGLSYTTYKKIASRFYNDQGKTLFESHINAPGRGIKKNVNKMRVYGHSIMDLLEGRASKAFVRMRDLKPKLIIEGVLKEECARCKYRERRVLDQTVPLILNFVDGDKKNWTLQNLELLCYNCYYNNVGDIFTKKQLKALEDWKDVAAAPARFEMPDNIQTEVDILMDFGNSNRSTESETFIEEEDDSFGEDLISYQNKKK